ncbi:Positive regulator GrlA [Salmonella enterica subsp. diarizonae]|nr:Positive regulator GrlA [Salmonella enterica subsp. diarizonae]
MCPDNTHAKKQFIFPADDIHYPGQTNHDACFIPECVRQYNGEPLYILVAHWCLLQQNWVQRSQIPAVFRVRLFFCSSVAGRTYRKSDAFWGATVSLYLPHTNPSGRPTATYG